MDREVYVLTNNEGIFGVYSTQALAYEAVRKEKARLKEEWKGARGLPPPQNFVIHPKQVQTQV